MKSTVIFHAISMKLKNKEKQYFKPVSYISFFVIAAYIFLTLPGCNSDKSDGTEPVVVQNPIVSPLLFGANYDWIDLAAGTVEYGDIIRDRSFRSRKDITNKVQVWGELTTTGGTINFLKPDSGDTNPAGGKYYPGYVELSQSSGGFTGITQLVAGGVIAGQSYQVTFSSYGDGNTGSVEVYLYNDDTYSVVLDSKADTFMNGAWKQHTVTLTPSAGKKTPILGLYLTTAGTIKIDEVRMFRSGSVPSVSANLKTAVQNLGVKSLRWPGGTLVDWFYWTDSIGSLISRGELQAYNYYETPALGLHEFLNLCEELNIEPLVQVNVLDTAQSAADLVEYILGSATSTQGAIRAANGHTEPWDVRYFEIGNEPSLNYTLGLRADTGTRYVSLANPIIASMKTKALSLNKTITLGAMSEPCFQIADWMVSSSDDLLNLLYNWNSQVFNPATGITGAEFTNGHFYSNRYYTDDKELMFRMAMTGGTVLEETLDTKITPVTALPMWLTEYHHVSEISGVVQAEYLKDFQAGLSIADILMSIISRNLPGAYIYNLIDTNGFGIMLDPVSGKLRPGGLVFRMFSVMAGEEILSVSTDNTATDTITAAGNGNVPAGLTYPLVSALATKNSVNGKQRVMLINRDYSADITVHITLEDFVPGIADTCSYKNADIAANNETAENVVIETGIITVGDSFDITIPAHSLIRIDFR